MRPDQPTLDRLSSINADGSRKGLQPADVHGQWVNRRRVFWVFLVSVYVGLPFIDVGGHPALQLDVASRRFYVVGTVFNAQDFWRFVFVLLAIGSLLFFFTAWLGRVWCGWACPQTVFLEGIYRPIERLVEGPREVRMRRNAGPVTFDWIRVKAITHGIYLVLSAVFAHVMLAYFVSLPNAYEMVRHSPREHWTAFVWVTAFTGITYFVMAWFREQVCVVVCPYGRLQSVLLDRDSLLVGYDARRGEPRGRMTRAERSVSLPVVQAPSEAAAKKGDCVDCGKCVAVCPTGIDIRNGLQLDCVACTQCIDACDEVMRKVGRPEGLIRYDSLNGLEGQPRRGLRPRLFAYAALVAVAFSALALVGMTRKTFEANLVRVQGVPYALENGAIRNQYELHLVNKQDVAARFEVAVSGPVPLTATLPLAAVEIEALGHYRLPIVVRVAEADYAGPFQVEVRVQAGTLGTHDTHARFTGPIRATKP